MTALAVVSWPLLLVVGFGSVWIGARSSPPAQAVVQSATAAGQAVRTQDADALRVVSRYVDAIGGPVAVDAVTSRVTRGTFTNGRGQSAPFVGYFKVPHRIATIIGRQSVEEPMGSGRAYDGAIGWDKNFIGTGLRDVGGAELDALARGAVAFPVLHLGETCRVLLLETPVPQTSETVVKCETADGVDRWFFDLRTGLAVRHELSVVSPARTTVTHFEDYRRADGLMVAFRTRSITGNNVVTYAADSIRHQVPIDDGVFRRPRQ